MIETSNNEKYVVALNIALKSAKTSEEKISMINAPKEEIIKKYFADKNNESNFSKALKSLEDCIL